MSLRHLALSVVRGQKVTFHILDADSVTGYLSAIDDDFYYVIVPEGSELLRRLVSRRYGVMMIDLHDEHTYEHEPAHATMEEIIEPFRVWVARQVLGRQAPQDTRKAG